jgi:hypothetical protein
VAFAGSSIVHPLTILHPLISAKIDIQCIQYNILLIASGIIRLYFKRFYDIADTFDRDYVCTIVDFFLLDLGLSNLGKHLLLVKERLQSLLINLVLCLPYLVYYVSKYVSMDGDMPGLKFHLQVFIHM